MNNDILNLIFNSLWYLDINNCRLVCKNWNNAIKENNYQYKRIVIDQIKQIFPIKSYKSFNFCNNLSDQNYFYFLNLLPNNFSNDSELNHQYNLIEIIDNKIYFKGTDEGGDRVVFLNGPIPKFNFKDPFILPVKNGNTWNLFLSNLYYFEITVGKDQFREEWDDECVAIGFVNRDNNSYSLSTNIGYQVGWKYGSFGYHSDDGAIFTGNSIHNETDIEEDWGPGDTVGAGILFENNSIKVFFTKNGKFLGFYTNLHFLNLNDYQLTPAVSIDTSYPVEVNFGQEQFVFNLTPMLQDSYRLPKKIPNNFKNNVININDIYKFEKNVPYKTDDQILEEISSNFLQDLLVQFIMNG